MKKPRVGSTAAPDGSSGSTKPFCRLGKGVGATFRGAYPRSSRVADGLAREKRHALARHAIVNGFVSAKLQREVRLAKSKNSRSPCGTASFRCAALDIWGRHRPGKGAARASARMNRRKAATFGSASAPG